jgi:hypothetical protein
LWSDYPSLYSSDHGATALAALILLLSSIDAQAEDAANGCSTDHYAD